MSSSALLTGVIDPHLQTVLSSGHMRTGHMSGKDTVHTVRRPKIHSPGAFVETTHPFIWNIPLGTPNECILNNSKRTLPKSGAE